MSPQPPDRPFSHAHLLHDQPTPGPCGAAEASFCSAHLAVNAPLPAVCGTTALAFRGPR